METEGIKQCLQKTHSKGLYCQTYTTDGDTKTTPVLSEYNETHNLNATQCLLFCYFFV